MEASTSDRYQDYLISHLKDPTYSAVYLETHLEESEPDHELLRLALQNVAQALGTVKLSPEQEHLHIQKLDEIFSEKGSHVLYRLAGWLNVLGLKLTVTVDQPESE